MNTQDALNLATDRLRELAGTSFDILTLGFPPNLEAALSFVRVTNKLSPILANLLEMHIIKYLNSMPEFATVGQWKRQDPDFPDAILVGGLDPAPGFEIKAWYPLSTEITARFKDSQKRFEDEATRVALVAWLPEKVIHGRLEVISVEVFSGRSVAEARDRHYHKPPKYLVIEPEDTSARTANLQQTNTSGYRIQERAPERIEEAEDLVASWTRSGYGRTYNSAMEYQRLLHELMGQFRYRLDTNFAKIDRIEHEGIEDFKARVLSRTYEGISLLEWSKLLFRGDDEKAGKILAKTFGITEQV